jgi:hypothetical protein
MHMPPIRPVFKAPQPGTAARRYGRVWGLVAPLVLAACASVSGPTTIAPFSTDGCSLFPDRSTELQADWCDCCLAHDWAYWRGGTEDARLHADLALKACVQQRTGNPGLAQTMFLGVRAGGAPLVHTPFRWGYGWPYGRGYRGLTEAESADVRAKEEEYRATHPGLQCQGPGERQGDGQGAAGVAPVRCRP